MKKLLLLFIPFIGFSNFEIVPNPVHSSDITSTGVSVSATMNSDGSLGGSVYLWYGEGNSLSAFQSVGVSVWQGVTMNGVTLSGTLSDLNPSTQYVFRWAIANSSGSIIYYSNQISFVTGLDPTGGQGDQRYADGTATDQEGNAFEWINYASQDWTIENAKVETYRDGTPILKVTDPSDWSNLSIGAWCYYDNNPSKGKLYNWYAVMGIHDNDENTPNKEFAPEGWRVPTDAEWTILEQYLIADGYNYDGTTSGSLIGKAMASTTGWNNSNSEGTIGNNITSNNTSGFNIFPHGYRSDDGSYYNEGNSAFFWTSSTVDVSNGVWNRDFSRYGMSLYRGNDPGRRYGASMRFVRDASTASIKDYSNAITIYPNPTTSIVTLQGDKDYDIEVYTLQGKKVMALTGNTIDMSHLSSATYIVKALDKVENEEVSYKVVKN